MSYLQTMEELGISEGPIERILWARRKSGLNAKEFAKSVGMTQSGFHFMTKRRSRVSPALANSVELVHGIRAEWILTGEGMEDTIGRQQGRFAGEKSLVAIVDTREQRPLALGLTQVRATLQTGDYTLRGLEDQGCVERKSLGYLVGCMTSGRERFEREMQRMLAFPQRVVVVESSFGEMSRGEHRSQLPGLTAINTVASWTGRFEMPFIFAETRDNAAKYITHFMVAAAKRAHQRLKLLSGG